MLAKAEYNGVKKGSDVMLAVKSADVGTDFREWCDKINTGETVVISRPQDKNIYMINEDDYNALQKAKRNAEYLAKIDESVENHEKGDTISFTMEELRAMESEDWKPTEKVLEFEKKHGIQRNGETIK